MRTAITEQGSDVRTGFLMLKGWHGLTKTKVEVTGETPKKYRIRAITETRLAGRAGWLNPGETALVPKYAVDIEDKAN